MVDLFRNIEFTVPLARAIVDTVREPILVLGPDLRVIAASRSFPKDHPNARVVLGVAFPTPIGAIRRDAVLTPCRCALAS